MMQQLILLGTFFVLPVYLQVVLGLDAFETGKRLFPMSVTMFLAAMAGPRLAAGFAPKRVAQVGLLALVVGVGRAARDDRRRARRDRVRDRAGALRRRRGPAALPARQRDHVVGRPREDQRGGRPPGHRPEPRRVARHGADRRGADRRADQRLRRRASSTTPRVPAAGSRAASPRSRRRASRWCRSTTSSRRRSTQGVPADQAKAIADDYGDAQLQGLKRAIGAVGIFALLSLWFTRGLPGRAQAPRCSSALKMAQPTATTGRPETRRRCRAAGCRRSRREVTIGCRFTSAGRRAGSRTCCRAAGR